MSDQGDPLARIAEALERLSPQRRLNGDWHTHPAYLWTKGVPRPIERLDALPLDRLQAIDKQKRAVVENVARHANGFAAHDILLWGARGMGKSALLLAAIAAQQAKDSGALALVQLDHADLASLPELYEAIGDVDRQFFLMLDDLAFDHSQDAVLRQLRSALEGGLPPRPGNIRLAVTSNHRAVLMREENDQSGPLHSRDRMDDTLALADRFGLKLGFHPCDQSEYLAIVASHAAAHEIEWSEDEALAWSRERGHLSGRTAQQFVVELAGRAGKQA